MTPAETPVSTVSVNRRRSSSCAVGLDQLALLALDLVGHAVEGAAERGELVVLLAFRHAGRQVAGPHPVGGADQAG